MMWASLLLAGILSGWWGAFALAAAPPANSALAGSTGGGDSSDVISSAAITPSSVRHVGDSSTSAMTTPARTDDFRGFEPATSPPPPTSPRATDAVHDVFSLDRIHPRDTWKTERRSQTQIARTVEATERGDDFPTKLAENRSDDFSPAAENRDDSVERIGGDDFTPDPAENRDTSLDRRRGENRNADFSPASENLDERIGGEDFTPDPAENRDTSEDQRRGENSSAKVAFSIGPLLENFAGYQVTPTSVRREIRNGDHDEGRDPLASSAEASSDDTSFEDLTELQDYSLDDEEWPRKSDTGKVAAGDSLYPSLGAENSPTSSASTATLWAEVFGPGTDQRTRVSRSTKQQQQQQQKQQQRAANRTRSDSAREQRRKCRNKGCRGRNWCPDMDIGNRAFLAPTVFEGKARSMSSLRKPGSNYAVTFEVKQVYKSQPSFQPLQKNDSVRLHFRDKAAPGKSTLCGNAGQQQQQQQRDSPGGVVRANIKRGKVYLVFVNRVGPRNFTILGEPVIRSKKNEQAVQAVIRPDYVRQVTLSELRDSVARLRDRVKLVCRTRGSPPPRVHWLKDGVPLHPRRGLRIQHKRRRSKVVIASARQEDSGRYECVAESTSGHRASLTAQLLVDRDTRVQDTTTAAWPRQEQPCPIAGDFCMNGGTCLFFETVGEPACRCAEGFTGLRCETKDVISTGSVYNRHRAPFSCKLGLSTSYYC